MISDLFWLFMNFVMKNFDNDDYSLIFGLLFYIIAKFGLDDCYLMNCCNLNDICWIPFLV
jgi:hypothetical protein